MINTYTSSNSKELTPDSVLSLLSSHTLLEAKRYSGGPKPSSIKTEHSVCPTQKTPKRFSARHVWQQDHLSDVLQRIYPEEPQLKAKYFASPSSFFCPSSIHISLETTQQMGAPAQIVSKTGHGA